MLKPFATTRFVIYYFIHCYHQLHSSDSPNNTYHWNVPRKCMGSAFTAINFPYFLNGKERYNPVDYFRMGIMEEIRFFFFDVQDPVRNQKLCQMMRNIEKQGVWIAKKKVKIYIRHSQKNLRHYIFWVVFKQVFRTQLKIHDQWSSTW